MTTTLTQLRTILDTHSQVVDGQQYPTLTLPASAFADGTPLAATMPAYLDGGQLKIQSTKPVAQDTTQITITGKGQTAPFNGMFVTAVFGIVGDEAALDLVASSVDPDSKKDSWNFAQSFPALAGQLADRLSFTGVSLTFSSRNGGSLAFAGDLALQGALAAASWLIGGSTSAHLTGSITLKDRVDHPAGFKDKVPVMILTAPVGSSISLGSHANLQFVLALEGQMRRPDLTKPALARTTLSLSADFTFRLAGRDVPLPIRCEFDDTPGLLYFVADTANISQVAFNDLAQLAEGAALGDALPSSDWLSPGDLVQVSSITFVVDPSTGLAAIGMVVSTTRSWEIIGPDIVTIEQPLSLNFTLLDPLGSGPKSVGLALTGAVGLGPDAVLDVSASYPDFSVAGTLEPDSTINISGVVEHFLRTKADLPTLDLDRLELYAQPGKQTYEFAAAIVTDFKLNVGIATLALEALYVAINRAPDDQSQPKTTAEIRASTKIGTVELDIDWIIPGSFSAKGQIPQIDLTDLAQDLTGSFMTLPSGFPDLALENSTVAIVITSGQVGDTGATYDLSLATTLKQLGSKTGIPPIDFAFELRKGTGVGFVVGLAVPDAWSPADIFPEFSDLLSVLTFKGSALILSSSPQAVPLPANLAAVPNLPASVAQGVTFATTLAFEGKALEPLKSIFGDKGLALLAVFDPVNVSQSQFVASIGANPNSTGIVVWHGFSLIFTAKSETITLQTSLTITFQGNDGVPDVLKFVGGASIPLNPTEASITFYVAMVGDWHDPFGIPQIDILGVGINLVISPSGFSIGVAGRIEIGDPAKNDQVIFDVAAQLLDGEAPGALVLGVKSSPSEDKGVTLPQLIKGFTSLDIGFVPLLNDIALKELAAYVVDNPTGFPDPLDPTHIYAAGFTVRADMIFFGLEAKVDVEVLADKGVKASGSLSEVVRLGNVLVISDASGSKGASALIDTTAITGGGSSDYLRVSGLVSLFNTASAKVDAKVNKGVFYFELDFDVADIEKFTLGCNLQGMKSFAAGATVNMSLPALSIDLKSDGLDVGTLTMPPFAVAGKLDLTLSLQVFNLDVGASFDFHGTPLGFSYTIHESFQDLGKLVAKTASELAAQGWAVFKTAYGDAKTLVAALGRDITRMGDDFGKLLHDTYGTSLQDAFTYFKQANIALTDFARNLKRGYQAGAEDIAQALLGAGYKAEQIANVLANGLKTSADDAAQIFYDLGFGADQMIALLKKYFGKGADEAKQIVEGILNRSSSMCGVHAFARAVRAPQGDVDDLQKVRADLQACPAGSKGQWYLQLYDQYSGTVHRLITSDPDVKAHIDADNGRAIWDAILDAFHSAQSGNPKPFPGGDVEDRALDVLAIMMQKDDGLADAINQVWPDIQSYEGFTYAQFLQAAHAPHPTST